MELPLTPQSLNDDERDSVSNKNGTWVRLKKHTQETWYSENEDDGKGNFFLSCLTYLIRIILC